MAALIKTWNRFWFAPASSFLLSRVRIFTGLFVALKRLGLTGLYHAHELSFDADKLRVIPSASKHILAGYNRPVFDGMPVPGLSLWGLLETAQLYLALLLMFGLGTRVVAPLLFFSFTWLHLSSRFDYRHHHMPFIVALGVLSVFSSSDYSSVDRRLFQPQTRRSVTPLRLLQVFVVTVYVSTFLGKLNTGWLDGSMMRLLHDRGHMTGPYFEPIYQLLGPVILCHFTLLAEGTLALGLVWRKTRPLAMLLGVALHTGIDLMMPVTTFGYQMTSLYLVFCDPTPHLTRAQVPAPRLTGVLDWLGRLKLCKGPLAVTRPDGQELRGLPALIELLYHLPITFPLAALPYMAMRARGTTGSSGRGETELTQDPG